MDSGVIVEHFPRLMSGAWITVQITVISLILGFFIAVPAAAMRLANNLLLRLPVQGFMFYFRGTPLLVQLFLIYYGSGQLHTALESVGLWMWFREAWFCAVLTLTLNTAAYTAEILRGAIQGVPRGEVEAGRAVGMSGVLLFRRIIMPKAFRIALPAYGNEVVFLLQATSLVSTITLLDLTGVARRVIAQTFAVYEVFIAAAVIYLVMVYALVFLFRWMERRLHPIRQ
ncbi:MAG: Octopine transport system permease protein OccM [Gammaproteobacteria bacterium]|nr:Octopine transport system permease protein OccM [Gammaproteobacteria bacterium]